MLSFLTESSQKAFTIGLDVRKCKVDFFREAFNKRHFYQTFVLIRRFDYCVHKVIMFIYIGFCNEKYETS